MSIQLCNLRSGETIGYSLPLLVGEVTPPISQATVVVRHRERSQALAWPIHNGQFKALVQLQRGLNHIQFSFYGTSLDFTLHYQVPKLNKFVRPIYLIAADDDGHFQGPPSEDTSPASALRRITLAAKLLQTFTAEKLHEHGLGRRTFVLENDLYAKRPPCMVFKSRITVAEAFRMTGNDLWLYFAKEMMSSRLFTDKDICKWFAFISFTRYQPPQGYTPKSHSEILKYTKGHTALGGGGLALYGTGNLHTWAECLEDISPCFTNANKIDRTVLMDDSAYRQTYWANYSTGLGASLHELGHTFDLAHTPTGVMARGFDDLYKVFTVHPVPSSRSNSQESSRQTSPVPCSPWQSPVHHRSRMSSTSTLSGGLSRSSSPKPSRLTQPPSASLHPAHPGPLENIDPVPTVVQIETAFKQVKLDCSQTMTVKNYDGSETQRTIVKHRDGTETVTEVTLHPSGEQVAREMVKNLATGKTRLTMSMSARMDGNGDSPGAVANPSHLPRSPDEGCSSFLSFQEVQHKDGGAHWYRASAIMLRYHKWFVGMTNDDANAKPPTFDGNVIESIGGLRLVEIRSLPENMVLHHWEFLHARPPNHFYLQYSELREITQNAVDVTVVAEDSCGNIVKKKIKLETLQGQGPHLHLTQHFSPNRSRLNGSPVPKNDNLVAVRQSITKVLSSPVMKPKSRLVQQAINSSEPVIQNRSASDSKQVSQGSTTASKSCVSGTSSASSFTSINGATDSSTKSYVNGTATASTISSIRGDHSLKKHSSHLSDSPTQNGTIPVGPDTAISVMDKLMTSNGLVALKQPPVSSDKVDRMPAPCNGTVLPGKNPSLTNQQNGVRSDDAQSLAFEQTPHLVWSHSVETQPEKGKGTESKPGCEEMLR